MNYILTITANGVTSTDTQFTMDNLGLGDNYKPIDVCFKKSTGEEIRRRYNPRERKMTNQTLPRLAFQIFENDISKLSAADKKDFPVCQYTPTSNWIKGIFHSVEDFKKYKKSIEYVVYKNKGTEYVIYCWNIFTTISFVQECLKRFKSDGSFELTYCEKNSTSKNNSKNNLKDNDNTELINGIDDDSDLYDEEISLNTILYGPPGTGKTYNTAIYAIAICDGCSIESLKDLDYKDNILPRYQELIDEERIVFTTFHQSYGYEDFVEGIKPQIDDTNGKKEIYYDCENGKFKDFCESVNKSTWFDTAWNSLLNDVNSKGMTVEIQRPQCTKKLKWNEKNKKFYDTKESMKDQYADYDSVKGIYDDTFKVNKESGANQEKYYNSKALLEKLKKEYKYNKVFIIDEINRGNISKIFGELITLIEDDKRDKMFVTLPYSKKKFTVPKNVYILGTMNTADRSIALMDTALRRRFDFVEMMPDTELFGDIEIEGISIKDLLKTINDRIEYLYDREHTIGHAYFKECINGNADINTLRLIFKNKIIPLLQEYFYDDYEKISLVLGDSGDKLEFVKRKECPKGLDDDGEVKFDLNNEICDSNKVSDEDFAERLKQIYED